MKNSYQKIIQGIFILTCSLMLCSCYSVRLVSSEGAPQPDPTSKRKDKYKRIQVVEIDTVIKLNVTSKSFDYRVLKKEDQCDSGKLHSVEYRNTFGGLLLSAITFGRKRKMKVIYVCMKDER